MTFCGPDRPDEAMAAALNAGLPLLVTRITPPRWVLAAERDRAVEALRAWEAWAATRTWVSVRQSRMRSEAPAVSTVGDDWPREQGRAVLRDLGADDA